MKQEHAHTKTPWKFQDEYIRADALNGDHGNIVADPYCLPQDQYADEMKANAAFIVRACNAHDDLVAALESLIRAYHTKSMMPVDKFPAMWADSMAALAKAKGEA